MSDYRVSVIREVLIAAIDMVPVGEEPYVGWSQVLAERIEAALVEFSGEFSDVELARRMAPAMTCCGICVGRCKVW